MRTDAYSISIDLHKYTYIHAYAPVSSDTPPRYGTISLPIRVAIRQS